MKHAYVINPEGKTVYGFFHEIPGSMPKVVIDANWVHENVAEYKKQGMPLENCLSDLLRVVEDEFFQWNSPEMKEQFTNDITTAYNS